MSEQQNNQQPIDDETVVNSQTQADDEETTIFTVADALADVIESGDSCDTVSVQMYPAENLGAQENGLICIVKPNDMNLETDTRKGGNLKYYFEVGFLKWIAAESESVGLLKKVEKIVKDMLNVLLLDGAFVITALNPNILYSVKAGNRRSQFASVWTVEVTAMDYT